MISYLLGWRYILGRSRVQGEIVLAPVTDAVHEIKVKDAIGLPYLKSAGGVSTVKTEDLGIFLGLLHPLGCIMSLGFDFHNSQWEIPSVAQEIVGTPALLPVDHLAERHEAAVGEATSWEIEWGALSQPAACRAGVILSRQVSASVVILSPKLFHR